jgi:hypothetical protein
VYTPKDTANMNTAITETTNKFGPSESLKNANSVLEHTIEVSARMSNDTFFDLKYMFVSIVKI